MIFVTVDHTYSECLAERLNDTGRAHSPVYAFANDGFPVYGPYQAQGTLAVSCWQARNYSDPLLGCKGGERTCTFINNLLPYSGENNSLFIVAKNKELLSAGTKNAAYPGPPLNGTVETVSGNYINSSSGIYYQDYYYNSSCTLISIAHLDQFNGHNHGSYGYHYHITINAAKKPVFPFSIGPSYYGCLPSSKCAVCATSTAKYPGNCTVASSSVAVVPGSPSAIPTMAATAIPTATFQPTPTHQPTVTYQPTFSFQPSYQPTFQPTVISTIGPSGSPVSSSSSSSSSSSNGGSVIYIAVGAAVGGAFLIAVLVAVYCYCARRDTAKTSNDKHEQRSLTLPEMHAIYKD